VAKNKNPPQVERSSCILSYVQFRLWFIGEKNMEEFVNTLITRGKELLVQPYQRVEFTRNNEADDLLNDIRNYPHAFVLGCVMDRQIKAERAWLIPYEISREIGSFEFLTLRLLDLDKIREIFVARSLHRFNDIMAKNFYWVVQKIHEKYNDDATNIWRDTPKSAGVVRRFLQFKGVGIKIASMAANILARDFKIPMTDKLCIDVSPDIQVKRVFIRLGLIDNDATNDELIYCARELYPEYPGIFDFSAWEIGRNWCRPKEQSCEKCYLGSYCPKVGASRNSR
jgi:uncharacterized HhH-GPD family protein